MRSERDNENRETPYKMKENCSYKAFNFILADFQGFTAASMAIASGSRYSCSNSFITERALGHNTYFQIFVISEEA